MDYQTTPDIDFSSDLTPNRVRLFQRFTQDADRATVNALVEAEVQKHVKLCELAILHYAAMDYSWAELPNHPIQDIASRAFQRLRDRGWKVEVDSYLNEGEFPEHLGAEKRRKATDVIHRITVNWLSWGKGESRAIRREWDRRESLEKAELEKTKWEPFSTLKKGQIVSSDGAWAAIVDGKYLAEVQRRFQTNYLCVFDAKTGQCLHHEETDVAFGADFGPDQGDVAHWEARVATILSARKKRRKTR